MDSTRIIEKLASEAKHNSDPGKLRDIATTLDNLGAYDKAQVVRNKQHEQERKYAEKAGGK